MFYPVFKGPATLSASPCSSSVDVSVELPERIRSGPSCDLMRRMPSTPRPAQPPDVCRARKSLKISTAAVDARWCRMPARNAGGYGDEVMNGYALLGGRERFSLAFVAASVAMASVTYGIGRYAYGLFLPEIRRDFALDTFTLGLIASVGTAVYLLSNMVASAIAVHFRPRTFIVIGGAVTTLGLALV